MAEALPLGGSVDPGFEPVRDAFAEVVGGHDGTGAALAVWRDGRWVVDLWGGWQDVRRTRPWGAETLVMPYSVTKPFAAVCLLLLADRGLVELEAPAAAYWPELTAPATVRDLLAHRAGLVVLDGDAPTEAFFDWQLMCRLLERQQPSWPPGSAHGESALFYGHLVGEVVRRVDGRTPGRFLREEVCGPLGLAFHVGLRDEELPLVADLTGYGDAYRAAAGERPPTYARALGNPPGASDPAVVNSRAWRQAEIPAINGHGNARGVAGLYVALHEGRLLSREMLQQATTVVTSGTDRVFGVESQWGLGFGIEQDGFGMGGLGGSIGWWSESGQYAFGFVTGLVADYDRSERLENVLRGVLGLASIG